ERKLSRWRTEREGQGMRHAKLVVHRKNVQGRRHEVRFTEHGACPGGLLVRSQARALNITASGSDEIANRASRPPTQALIVSQLFVTRPFKPAGDEFVDIRVHTAAESSGFK